MAMKQQVNLAKSLTRPSTNWFKDDVVLGIAGIFLVLLCVVTFYQFISMQFAKHQYDVLQKQYIEMNARFVKEQRGLFELTEVQQELASKTKLLELLHVSLSRSPTCPNLTNYFQSLSTAQVAGLWLTDFQVEPDTRNMTFSGTTYDPILIVTWLQALGKTPCFADVKFYTIDIQKIDSDTHKNLMTFTVVSSRPKGGVTK